MTALAAAKPRTYLQDFPLLKQKLPLKAAAVVYAGSILRWTSGAVEACSGAGTFAGIAKEDATGGAADGSVEVDVYVQGVLREKVNTDATTLGIVGVAATVPEATDDDTIRIETGSAITGTAMGKFQKVITVATGGIVDISFKGAHLA